MAACNISSLGRDLSCEREDLVPAVGCSNPDEEHLYHVSCVAKIEGESPDGDLGPLIESIREGAVDCEIPECHGTLFIA